MGHDLQVREHEHISAPQRSPANVHEEADDVFGELASVTSGDTKSQPSTGKEGYLQLIAKSFSFIHTSTARKLSDLQKSIGKHDEPDKSAQIMEGVLELALGAAGAGVAEILASHVVDEHREGLKEFVKVMFESSAETGIEAGKHKLAELSMADALDMYVGAQLEASEATAQGRSNYFDLHGQQKVRTLEQASRLADACSPEHTLAAADRFVETAWQGWLSYLAQSRFGSVHRDGSLAGEASLHGETTMNVRAGEELGTAAIAQEAPGVLALTVYAPEISWYDWTTPAPFVNMAILNGANEELRAMCTATWATRGLEGLRIPRHIVVVVGQGASVFAITLNESGAIVGRPAQTAWLRRRALVGHPGNAGLSEQERDDRGLHLLLQDLRATHITKGAFT